MTRQPNTPESSGAGARGYLPSSRGPARPISVHDVFPPLAPADEPVFDTAGMREKRLTALARLGAEWLHADMSADAPQFLNLRDGGNLPDDRSRMGPLVVFCLIFAGASVAARFWGWV